MKTVTKTNVLICGIAALLLLGTVLATLPFKNTIIHGLWTFINERGIFPYLSIYSGYINILALVLVWRGNKKENQQLNCAYPQS